MPRFPILICLFLFSVNALQAQSSSNAVTRRNYTATDSLIRPEFLKALPQKPKKNYNPA
jgi:hypothetical protein